MASGQPPGSDPLKPWDQTASAQNPSAQQLPKKFTEEEKQVMQECERNGFYQRALPLSIGAMVGAHMLVRSGRWAPHPRLGSLPKALIVGGMGYILGKLSYIPACQQKILEKIPNSNLAAIVRKSKGMAEIETPAAAWEDSSAGGGERQSKYKEDYSALEGLDDRFRPSVDRDIKEPKSAPEVSPGTTYEELRKRNRQEHEDQLAKRSPPAPGSPSYKDSSLMPQRPWPDNKGQSIPDSGDQHSDLDSSAPSSPPPPPAKKRTNIWGDPIE